MPRHQVPHKIRLEIKAYKIMYPKATLSEIRDEFAKRIGRSVQRATIMNILHEDTGMDESKLTAIVERANDMIGDSIAKKIARMNLSRQEIIAKSTDLINRKLDEEEAVSINDATKVLSEVTKIDQVLKGQPSEIHKIVKGIDDETLEFLSQFNGKPDNPIPGEVVPDVPAVPGEFEELGSGGNGEAAERGENQVFHTEWETGVVYPRQEFY